MSDVILFSKWCEGASHHYIHTLKQASFYVKNSHNVLRFATSKCLLFVTRSLLFPYLAVMSFGFEPSYLHTNTSRVDLECVPLLLTVYIHTYIQIRWQDIANIKILIMPTDKIHDIFCLLKLSSQIPSEIIIKGATHTAAIFYYFDFAFFVFHHLRSKFLKSQSDFCCRACEVRFNCQLTHKTPLDICEWKAIPLI